MNIKVPYLLGIMNKGVSYLVCCSGVSTTILGRFTLSLKTVSLLILGIGYYLPLKYLEPGFRSKNTVFVSYLTSAT